MRNEDRVRLEHMIEAAESAMQFISGRTRSYHRGLRRNRETKQRVFGHL